MQVYQSDGTTEFSKAYHGILRPHNDRGNPFQEAIYTYSRMQAPLQLQSKHTNVGHHSEQ